MDGRSLVSIPLYVDRIAVSNGQGRREPTERRGIENALSGTRQSGGDFVAYPRW